jgi:hypothetical protein
MSTQNFYNYMMGLFLKNTLAPVWLYLGNLSPTAETNIYEFVMDVLAKNPMNEFGYPKSMVQKMMDQKIYPNFFELKLLPDDDGKI